ncbi:MAG: glycogen/starch synthase [Tannerellaceae bacterium]|jgi:glycosyltransferase involved in cell wall biosynthesis|nr:glycogen/starch synthase [Tannerellaceae bacterium]
MNRKVLDKPEYIFESSWEVCNKVGGIYTVLSTKARTLQDIFSDKILFIGPWLNKENGTDFIEDKTLFPEWKTAAWNSERLRVRIGRWNVAGCPLAVLVEYLSFRKDINKIFYQMWDEFRVDSLKAYGDYEESCMFAYAAGRAVESFYRFYRLDGQRVVAHFNEWTLGIGGLYLRHALPSVATVFTTHATSVGRSMAGNGRALYASMEACDGDIMAAELNIEAKHSLEKQAAVHADCFTAVSDITASECRCLLGKSPDMVTPNGFESSIVPVGEEFERRRRDSRAMLIKVAERLWGCTVNPDTMLVSTSGRYEYRNKGLDIFIDALNIIRQSSEDGDGDIIAFVMVPGHVANARADLLYLIEHCVERDAPLQMPYATHWLHGMENDRILNYILQKGFSTTGNPRIIFIPCYLTGHDGIFNRTYYDLLPAMDLTVYPSYYEPWGYTPLESIAFGIPTITTTLAGFGLWALSEGAGADIRQGVKTIRRTDDNYFEASEAIAQTILEFRTESKAGRSVIRSRCQDLADRAAWTNFIESYAKAYDIALRKSSERMK